MANRQPEEEETSHSYPFSVDKWVLKESPRRSHFFLTHAHLDHTRGITSEFAPIHCTVLTARLVLLRHSQMCWSDFSFVNIEEPKLINDNDGGSFTVTAYDANHCPGAVMFLFEGAFGTVLHTGDCRLTSECFSRLPRRLFGGLIDCLYLDCTFGKEAVRMPTSEEAINQVKQCIWNHPDAPIIYLACDLLGQELLLESLSNAFGLKIFVDKCSLKDFHGSLSETAPDLITDDPQATRLHVCEGFPKLYEKAKSKFAAAYTKNESEPLFIRPSAQWYTYGERLEGVGSGLLLLEKIYQKAPSITKRRFKSAPTEAERDPFGIWHVCYSMHSSHDELELFVSKLKPRQVISTTPHCKATELSYVRTLKHSFIYMRPVGRSISLPNTGDSKDASDGRKEDTTSEPSLMHVSSPIKKLPLFGSAVAGLVPSPPLSFTSSEDSLQDSMEEVDTASSHHIAICNQSSCVDSPNMASSSSERIHAIKGSAQPGRIIKDDELEETIQIEEIIEYQGSSRNFNVGSTKTYSCNSSTTGDRANDNYGLGETARRIYRSLNMMVPKPLPSLLEVDREIKRGRFQ
ncbi:hypothetical protein KP509_14G035100 [Ceratopteris richardii]|uniref:Metallo-beta-lactamase domain-containing protein n=1 Tax=Ceratopteris richardii TaxID=49495 RepID=A0A8T2T8J0_CERRI|nr:hypothetical protein KP509_14G035100 [Ceratopteris richardii]